MCPSRIPDGEERGWIIPIGGAEDKESRRRILKRFVEICGGRDARIAVIPTASRMADTGQRYEALFSDLGARSVNVVDFDRLRLHKPTIVHDLPASGRRLLQRADGWLE